MSLPPDLEPRRPRLRELEDELGKARAQIDVLLTQLRAVHIEAIEVAPWMVGLRPQEIAIIAALKGAFPRLLDVYSLDEALPRLDDVADRTLSGVHVVIHGIRRKLGAEVIETVRGFGWRLSVEFAARLKTLENSRSFDPPQPQVMPRAQAARQSKAARG